MGKTIYVGLLPIESWAANGHLSRVSRLSGNDEGDNEMIPGAVHRSPGIYLTAKKNSGKP